MNAIKLKQNLQELGASGPLPELVEIFQDWCSHHFIHHRDTDLIAEAFPAFGGEMGPPDADLFHLYGLNEMMNYYTDDRSITPGDLLKSLGLLVFGTDFEGNQFCLNQAGTVTVCLYPDFGKNGNDEFRFDTTVTLDAFFTKMALTLEVEWIFSEE
jgi:hypothetical protein